MGHFSTIKWVTFHLTNILIILAGILGVGVILSVLDWDLRETQLPSVEPQQVSAWTSRPLAPPGYPVSWMTPSEVKTPVPWWKGDVKSHIKDLIIEKDPGLEVLVETYIYTGVPLGWPFYPRSHLTPFMSISIKTRVVNIGEPALIDWRLILRSKRNVRTDTVDCSKEAYQIGGQWAYRQVLGTGEAFVREASGTQKSQEFPTPITLLADCYSVKLEVSRASRVN